MLESLPFVQTLVLCCLFLVMLACIFVKNIAYNLKYICQPLLKALTFKGLTF